MLLASPPTDWIKICGIRSVDDARMCFDQGADAIGINLWPKSPRSLSVAAAAGLVQALGDVKGQIVCVTVDASGADLQRIRERVGPDYIQLHGDESEAWTTEHQPGAFKAVGLGSAADAAAARGWPGPFVLVDARDEVARGGTGVRPPETLAVAVCDARPTILAGGLTPENVYDAVIRFQPAGVDTASGVEVSPGEKDPAKVEAFVRQAREAFGQVARTRASQGPLK
jgi:phosphoribosylanthranilate isomerase